MGLDTFIGLISCLVLKIWSKLWFSVMAFPIWPPQPLWSILKMGLYLKFYSIYLCISVPSFMLLYQKERFFWYSPHTYCTTMHTVPCKYDGTPPCIPIEFCDKTASKVTILHHQYQTYHIFTVSITWFTFLTVPRKNGTFPEPLFITSHMGYKLVISNGTHLPLK